MRKPRLAFFSGLLALSGLFAFIQSSDAHAQSSLSGFPAKPLRLVVPFPPGGPTDIVARPLAQMLGDKLKQQVLVDNKGGAGGGIGAELVARAPSDGHILLMATVGTHAINGSLYKRLSYDAVRDFTPIALVASAPVVIVVPADSAIKTLADYIAQARKAPDTVQYGSAGNGTPGHLTGAMFEAAAQIQLKHIPYKGSSQAVTDLLGSQISSMFDPVQSVIAHIQSGKLRALAVTSSTRSPVLPNVPTVTELGFPQFESTAWWAVFAPAKLPEPITQQLRTNIEAIASSPAFADKLGSLGVVPNTSFKESLTDFQAREISKWAKAVRSSGATVD